MNASPSCLILGIGNCLRTDDGIGVHAARLLRPEPPPDTEVVDAGTDFFATLPFLERARHVLLIDAMDAGGPPGTLYRCRADALAATPPGTSLHDRSVLSVLEFLPPKQRPQSILVLGIQPAVLDFGTALSPAISAVLPAVLRAARNVIEELRLGLGTEVAVPVTSVAGRC